MERPAVTDVGAPGASALARAAAERVVGAFASGTLPNAKRDARAARVVTRAVADYHLLVNADAPRLDLLVIDELI
ncbi:MAG: hypothetical protein ACJ79R_10040 [Anaeromyxobacteraceae bacterium]